MNQVIRRENLTKKYVRSYFNPFCYQGNNGSFAEEFCIAVAMQNGIVLKFNRHFGVGDVITKYGKTIEIRYSMPHRVGSDKNYRWLWPWFTKRREKSTCDFIILIGGREDRDFYFIIPMNDFINFIKDRTEIGMNSYPEISRRNSRSQALMKYLNAWNLLS